LTFLLSILAAISLEAAGVVPVEANIAWVARGEFCEPETVLPLPDGNLLVSNVCGFSEPGSGFLTLLDAQGKVLEWRVVGGLDAPLGMALRDNRLHVVDTNRLEVFAWPGYELLETIELDTAVANDVAIAPDHTIYVSDTAGNQVIRILPNGEQSVFLGPARFPGANGIAVEHGYLYVGGKRLWRVSLGDHSVEVLGPEWLADIDGIEFETDGTMQLTPVGGPLVRYHDENRIEVFTGEGISSANHGYAENLNLALIPTGFDNTVIAIRIPE
jgi:hypothetical protein